MDLKGKVAIVTGAGRGLGRAHALAMARSGARVVVNDLDATTASQVSHEILTAGGQSISNSANVQSLDEIEDMVAQAIRPPAHRCCGSVDQRCRLDACAHVPAA